MAKEKKSAAERRPASVLVIIAAVLVPVVPLAFWLYESISMMPTPLETPVLGIYLLARVFALIGFVLMFYQFVLTSRLPLLDSLFQRANLLKQHRVLGRTGFLLILFHGAVILFQEPALYGAKTLGVIGLILLTAAVTAAWFFKPLRLTRKTWRTIHLAVYVVFPLVFVHSLSLGSTVNGYRPVYWLFVLLFAVYLLILLGRIIRVVTKKS